MTNTVARGVIEVDIDGTGVKAGVTEAKRSLADLATAAEQSGQRAAKGMDTFGSGGDKAARKVEQSTKSIISSIQRQIAQMEAGSKSGSKYFEVLASQRGVSADAIKPYLAQLNAANDATKTFGLSAEQTAQNLRYLPNEIRHIADSLASGQSPFQILVQQGGHLSTMFGGVGQGLKQVGIYALGLINPFTLGAAAVALLTLAYKQGSDEQTAYAKSIVLTGNYAGVTAGMLASMAKHVDRQAGTAHDAADALQQLVATGELYGNQLSTLAVAAVAWEKATGTAVKDTIANFDALARDPVSAAEKLNEKYHFLTAAVYEQIRALVEQGRGQDAARIAEDAYASALKERADKITQNLGTFERAWMGVKNGAKEAWDAVLDVGRVDTLDDKLKAAQARLDTLKNGKSFYSGHSNVNPIDAAQRTVDSLTAQKNAEENKAKDEAQKARVNQFAIDAEKNIAQIREQSLSNAEKRQKAIADYLRDIDKVRTANPSSALLDQGKIDRDIQNIKQRFKDTNIPDSAAASMLQKLREEQKVLEAQLGENVKINSSRQDLLKFEQQIADIKEKRVLTLDQKSLLANNDLIEAQLKRNAALEAEIVGQRELQKLLTFRAALDSKSKLEKQSYDDKISSFGLGKDAQKRLKEQLQIQRDHQHDVDQLNAQFNSGQVSQELYDKENRALQNSLDERLKNWNDYYSQLKNAESDWKNGATAAMADYMDAINNTAEQTYNLIRDTVDQFSRGVGDAFEKVIFDSQSLSDAFDNLANGMARAVVNALGQMAAEWLAYQAVQLLVGKSAQISASTMLIANAQATSMQAGLAAFASTAAIPIVGPILAPGAMAAAVAVTEPMVAAIAATTLAGIAHDGMSAIPREGTWLLNGGERVVAPQQNQDLTKFLSRQGSDAQGSGGDVIIPISVKTNDARDFQRSLQRGGALNKELRNMARRFSR